ncbi:hypothetical protein [Sphingomonas sp. MMS24-J13]|uniref:hypothetical protein n=1 Tax=Sphingomonas sp. MMS24-J13 TaxID=3238686 RepID=UPI00384AA308
MTRFFATFASVAILCAAPLSAATPREMLTHAAFQTTDKNAALAEVKRAIAAAAAQLAANPADYEAQMQHAAGIGYRAKLTRNAGDAKMSRRLFDGLAAANPRDPEAQMLIAGWNLDAIADLGSLLASAGLGAKKGVGTSALDRAVAMGRNRAFFPGIAALMRIRLDPHDVAGARLLAESAASLDAPTPLDRIAKRSAEALLIPLRAGDGKAAAALARQLLPFGRVS